jgi:hypothetical protein
VTAPGSSHTGLAAARIHDSIQAVSSARRNPFFTLVLQRGYLEPFPSTAEVVAIVFLDDRNINLEMAEAGWAWASRTGRNRPDGPEYQEAEEHARAAKSGLWSQADPMPPWEFRKLRKMEDLDNW